MNAINTWISPSTGQILLNISDEVVRLCYHSGDCLEDVIRCCKLPEIKEQLDKIDPHLIVMELQEYSDWDLNDRQTNLHYLIWIACGDITAAKEEEELKGEDGLNGHYVLTE